MDLNGIWLLSFAENVGKIYIFIQRLRIRLNFIQTQTNPIQTYDVNREVFFVVQSSLSCATHAD